MMCVVRALIVLALGIGPALAWETRSDLVCELFHDSDSASVLVRYDPAAREYSIAITPTQSWQGGPVFAMQFDGPFANVITTDRHVISDGGATLTVTDSGFGNVLDGLAFNLTATAILGDQAVSVPLQGAAPAVEDFRACAAAVFT